MAVGDVERIATVDGTLVRQWGRVQAADVDGLSGVAGASAYEVAVANGFPGDEAAWLASLVGTNGTNGTNGTDGTNGLDGTDGKTILNGTGAPGAVGELDDFYLDTTAHAIYGPLTGGGWGSATSLVGPAGPTVLPTETVNFVIDGGGAPISPGVKGDITLDFACNIVGWSMLADQTGSIVVDLWKAAYADFPPTVTGTITGAEKPTLTSAIKNQDMSLNGGGGWAVSSGDVLRYNVDAADTARRVTVALKVTRT